MFTGRAPVNVTGVGGVESGEELYGSVFLVFEGQNEIQKILKMANFSKCTRSTSSNKHIFCHENVL